MSKSSTNNTLYKQNALSIYLKELDRIKNINPQKQLELLREYKITKDKKTKIKITESLLKLVVTIASKYVGIGSPEVMDLIQEGNIGISKAIEKFDVERDNALSTYAVWWIRAYMNRYMANKRMIIRLPAYIYEGTRKINKSVEFLKCKLGREPTAKEIADKEGLNVLKTERLYKKYKEKFSFSSIDSIVAGLDITYEQLLTDDVDTTDERLEDSEMMYILKKKIEEIRPALDKREQYILERRMYTDESESLEQIGNEYDLSRERIRQIEFDLKEELREYLTKENPEYFENLYKNISTKKKGKKMSYGRQRDIESPQTSSSVQFDYEYRWTIELGVNVELKSNVSLEERHYRKLIKFIELMMNDDEPVIETTNEKTKRNLVAKLPKRNPKPKKGIVKTGKIIKVIKTTLGLLSPDWYGSGIIANKAIELGVWKDPPKNHQPSISSKLRRLNGKVDWLESKKEGAKTLYRYKLKENLWGSTLEEDGFEVETFKDETDPGEVCAKVKLAPKFVK